MVLVTKTILKFLTVLAQLGDICVQVIAEISRSWMPPASLKVEIMGLYNLTTNPPYNNMQKTSFKNSSWLSHNLKMFEYMSYRKNHQIDKVLQLTNTWSQNFGHHFQTI